MYHDQTSWRETWYNETFIQIENWGTTRTSKNTYMCLGQDQDTLGDNCKRGSQLGLVSCFTREDRMNLFQWVDGRVKAIGCQKEDLCVAHVDTGDMVLEYCDKASVFKRLRG